MNFRAFFWERYYYNPFKIALITPSKIIPKHSIMSTTTTTIHDLSQAVNEETDSLISFTSSQVPSRGSIFERWGRQMSLAPSTAPSVMPVLVDPVGRRR